MCVDRDIDVRYWCISGFMLHSMMMNGVIVLSQKHSTKNGMSWWNMIHGLHHKFCSSNKKFGPSDLISYINKKHNDRLCHGIAIYLRTLYRDAFGDGEFIWTMLGEKTLTRHLIISTSLFLNNGSYLSMIMTLWIDCQRQCHIGECNYQGKGER
mgnify:CR=1 FL=1